jgi:ceramide glucosyltransferase
MLLSALLVAAILYNWIQIWAALMWSRLQPAAPSGFLPVSILKPLRGANPWLYDCLATFCRLDYPAYELLFCTARSDDPAVEVVHRLQADFPNVTLRLFVADKVLGTNAKIDNLDKMYREARHEILVISDDDIVVPRDYLQHLVADLEAPDVGVVSCPYRGKSGGTAASAFEALGIASEFFGGVFVARQMEGIRFALGSTMAVRKKRVAEIGGFPALADYLADDYELGARITAKGYRNVLSRTIVDTQLPPDGWRAMLAHQFRWMRTQAISRPAGHIGLGVTYGSLWSIGLLVTPVFWHPHGFMTAWIVSRWIAAWWVGSRVLNDPVARRWWPLAPLRELFTASLWMLSLFRRTVIWRGERYRTVGGKIIRD